MLIGEKKLCMLREFGSPLTLSYAEYDSPEIELSQKG